MPRHRHDNGYIAVVLSGGFTEAGLGARVQAKAGTMIVHGPWEAHQDVFAAGGAMVLNLPNPGGALGRIGGVRDVDEIARLAARDPITGAQAAVEQFAADDLVSADWPDLLARDLLNGRVTSFERWAAEAGLRLASLSRGFRKAYGVTPKRYRYEMGLLRALEKLPSWRGTIASLAAAEGFADQAHFTRGITRLTGLPPGLLRVKSVQESISAIS